MNRRQWMMLTASAAANAQQAPSPAPARPTPEQVLLKDYNPRSIYKIPKSEIQKAKYPVIDAHWHGEWASEPDKLAEMVRIMDVTGVEKVVTFLRTGVPEKFAAASRAFSKYPDRFYMWCGWDLAGFDQPGFGPGALKSLEECHRLGALGIGEIIDKGRGFGRRGAPGSAALHIDDARMDPILDKCSQLGMPVNIHVSDPIWSYEPMDNTNDGLMNGYTWRITVGAGMLGHDELIEGLARAVAKHPRTIFVASHICNLDYDLSRLGGMFDRLPNFYADLGARFGEIGPIPRFAARFFEQYQDRLLYATDFTYTEPMLRATFRILESLDDHFYAKELFKYHWPLYGFGLTDAVLEKVYRKNALAVFDKARRLAS